jgi:hypothetical protein
VLHQKEEENEKLLEAKRQAEEELAYAMKRVQDMTESEEEKRQAAEEASRRRLVG